MRFWRARAVCGVIAVCLGGFAIPISSAAATAVRLPVAMPPGRASQTSTGEAGTSVVKPATGSGSATKAAAAALASCPSPRSGFWTGVSDGGWVDVSAHFLSGSVHGVAAFQFSGFPLGYGSGPFSATVSCDTFSGSIAVSQNNSTIDVSGTISADGLHLNPASWSWPLLGGIGSWYADFQSQQAPVGGAISAAEYGAGGSLCWSCTAKGLIRALFGDPIDTGSGAAIESVTDLTVPGRGPSLAMSHAYTSTEAGLDGPLGFGWSGPYSMHLIFYGPAVLVVQENGSMAAFLPDGAGGLMPAAPRTIASLTQNGDGSYTFVRQQQDTFTFDASGRLLSEQDLNGYVTSLHYSGSQLATVSSAGGRALHFAWTGSHITVVSDDLGRTVHFGYGTAGDLTQVTAADGGVTTYGYDSSHRLTSTLDPNQYGSLTPHPVINTYDSQGRVYRQTDQLGRITTYSYATVDANTSTTTVTDAKGNVTVYTYNYGLLVSTTRGYGTTAETTTYQQYDPITLGVISTITFAPDDVNTYATTAQYDPAGHPLLQIDGVGRVSTYTYNSLEEPLTVTKPNPSNIGPATITTTNTYDTAGIYCRR